MCLFHFVFNYKMIWLFVTSLFELYSFELHCANFFVWWVPLLAYMEVGNQFVMSLLSFVLQIIQNVYIHATMWNSPIRDFWYYNIVTLLAACFRIDSTIKRFFYQGTDFDIWEKVINLYLSMNFQLISCFQSSFLF